jgi:hypothetical protein
MKRVAVVLLVATNLVAGLAYCAQQQEAPKPDTKEDKAAVRAKRRAQAEAEAEAKNKANRAAYNAECGRLEAQHRAKIEKLKADNDAAYENAKATYAAGKKLHEICVDLAGSTTDGRATTKDAYKSLALRTLREFIKRYPDTQAAKDAATDVELLLKGGSPKIRNAPPVPVPAKLDAPELKLPPPPEPVAVVYPADLLEEERVERLETERREAQRLEAESREASRREAERMAAERREAMQREAERMAAERREAMQREAEHLAAKREAERISAAETKAQATKAGAAVGVLVFVIAICVGAFALWALPIIIAFMRGHPDIVAIAAIDLLFGWSFIGWGIALVWSLKAFMRPEFYQGAGYSPPPPPPDVRFQLR